MVDIIMYQVTTLNTANLRNKGYNLLFLASERKLITTPLPSNTKIVIPIYPNTYYMSKILISPGT